MNVEYLQQLRGSRELQDIEWAMCKKDPYYFLTNWALTLDVHDDETAIKSFPKKEYLQILCDIWLENRLLLIPKSRQMMITWVCVGLYLWDTQFHGAKLTFFQSKKEDDADDLVKRAKFIWDHEPFFLKRYQDPKTGLCPLEANPQNKGQHIFCKLGFPQINSEIRGIPQGGEILRMHTASGIFSDEMGFQPEAKTAYTASKPTISGKGRFTGVSTAEDGTFFEALVFDTQEMI
mgnify:CR=1 FL=1|jgi:hypothetical protein